MADVKIKITGDEKEFNESLERIRSNARDLSSDLTRITQVSGVAFAALSGAILGSVNAFEESEKLARQQEAVLKSTGFAAGFTATELNRMATSLSRSTTFSDEAVTSAQNLLLTFQNIGQKTFPDATKAILDMAQATGTDATSAAQTLGKALNDPIKGMSLLTRSGIEFTDQQQKQIQVLTESGQVTEAQAIILERLNASFGGSAAAAAQGTGVFIQLKNALGEIVEGIGAEFAPTLEAAARSLLELAIKIKDNDSALKQLASFIATGAIWTGLITAIGTVIIAFQKLEKATRQYRAIISEVGAGLTEFNQKLILTAANAVGAMVKAMFNATVATVKFGVEIKANLQAAQLWATYMIANVSNALKTVGSAALASANSFKTFLVNIGPNSLAALRALPTLMTVIGASFKKFAVSARTAGASAQSFFANFGSNVLAGLRAMPTILANMARGLKLAEIGMKAASIGAKLLSGALTLGIGIILPEIILWIQTFVTDSIANFRRATTEITNAFKNLGNNLLNIGSKIGEFLKALFSFNFSEIKAAAAGVKDAVTKAIDQTFSDVQVVKQKIEIEKQKEADAEKIDPDEAFRAEKEAQEKFTAETLANRKKANAAEIAENARKNELLKQQEMVQREIVTLVKSGANREIIKLKQDELAAIKALSDAKTADEIAVADAELQRLRTDNEVKRQQILADLRLEAEEKRAVQAEIDALDEEDRIIANEKNLERLSVEELQRREVLRQSAEAEVADRKKRDQQKIQDQIKFGNAYAAINAALNSAQVQGVANATGQLVQLQQSRNNTLKSIGKVAAITQIGIDTAKAAMSIYAGFATIPIIGPALGVAGAAAAIAFGFEKISQVRSAQQGGIVPGFGSGDSVPMFLEPGEIVVPKALSPSFAEQFGIENDPAAPPRRTTEVKVNTIIGTEEFVRSNIIPAIRDANELDNANIGVR